MPRALTLLESAQSRMRTIRQGDLAQLVADGGGAMVVPMIELLQAQKWAQRKASSGNMLTDRTRFLEQVATLISRPGSLLPTKGHHKAIEALAKQMMQAGYDINEWTLPPELRGLGRHAALEPDADKKKDKDAGKDDDKKDQGAAAKDA